MKTAVLMSVYKNDNLSNVSLAIESMLKQTSTIDLFVFIDGEIDCQLKKYLYLLCSKIRILESAQNEGLAKALNYLLRIVLKENYEFIARMDADDVSMSVRIEKQLIFMNVHPDIDCLGTWAVEVDSLGNDYFHKQMPVTHEQCLEMFKKRDCMIHPTVMFRRSYFAKAGLYPEDTYFGEDTMMWAQGFKNGCRFANLPEYLLKFRLDANFFQRRRGWRHAKSIFALRRRVNILLGFGFKEDCYAFLYALAKMMPTKFLDIIYRRFR